MNTKKSTKKLAAGKISQKILPNEGAVVTEPGSTLKNMTGDWRTEHPVIEQEACIRCGTCWTFCPDNCFFKIPTQDEKEFKLGINYGFCKGCGICAHECPVKCIKMVSEEK